MDLKSVGQRLAPTINELAPTLSTTLVREALHRAIAGFGPLVPAAQAADRALAAHDGDQVRAVHDLIETHVRYAGAQGFVTNLGGAVTAAVTVPANITGLAIVQCRMVAGIAHLRGYSLTDPRVRNAILTTVLGAETVDRLIGEKKLPAPPMALATAPVHDPDLDRIVSSEVTADLVAKVAGKRVAVTVGRRVPLVGLVGAGTDGYTTWRIGRYADAELLPRRPETR